MLFRREQTSIAVQDLGRSHGRGRSAGEAFHHPRFRFGRGHCCFVLGAFHCDTWSCNTGTVNWRWLQELNHDDNKRGKEEQLKVSTVSTRTPSKATPAMAGLDLRNLLMGHYSGSLVKGLRNPKPHSIVARRLILWFVIVFFLSLKVLKVRILVYGLCPWLWTFWRFWRYGDSKQNTTHTSVPNLFANTFSDRGGTDGLWSALSGLLIELSIPASGLSDFKTYCKESSKCI